MADINQTATVITRMNGEQPKQEIADIIKRLDKLKEARRAALDAGDTKTAENLRKQIEREEKALRKMQAAAVDVARVMKNLDKATPEELNRTLRALNKELKTMEHGSDAWNEHVKKIGEVKRAIASIQTEVKAATLSFPEQVKNSFNTLTSLTGRIATAYRSVIASVEPYAQMEAAMADTRKFTGLTTDEVEELNEAFQRMDTRSSREQLNLLAQEAGRLGKNTKEDILGYVEAADIINVALSDLGEGATQEIAKLADIFHLEETQSTRDAMLSVGSAVNTLSQNCSASAPYLVEFSKRMAGVGATANMDIQDILAFAAVLDSKGQQVEQSSSALGKLTMRLFQEPAKMAKMAGLDVEQFTQTLQRSTTEGLMMFLERIKELGANGGLSDLAPLFKDLSLNGVGLSNILTVLSDNLDMVRAQQQVARQAFEEGTSAVNEFRIANETAEARLQKHKKQLQETAIAFGKTMMPAVDGAVKGLNGLLTVVQASLRFLRDYGGIILSLTAGIAAYTIAVHLASIKNGILAAATWTAAKAQAAYNALLKANPWGLAAAAVTALIGILVTLARRTKELTAEQKLYADIQKQVNKQYSEEKGKIDLLNKAVHDETRSLADRLKALNELRAIVPGYHAELTDEGKLINDNEEAIEDYCTALKEQMALQAYQERLQEQYNRRAELEMRKDELTAQEKQDQSNLQNVSYTNRATVAGSVAVTDATVWQDRLKHTQRELEKTEKEAAEVDTLIKSINTKIEGLKPDDDGDDDDDDAPKKRKQPAAPKDDPIADRRARALAENEISYRIDDQTSYELYTRRKLEIERDYWKERMDAAKQGSTEYLQAHAELLKAQEALDRQSTAATVEEENRRYHDTQRILRQRYADGKMSAEVYRDAMEKNELEHLSNLAKLYKAGSAEQLKAQEQYDEAALKAKERHREERLRLEKQMQDRLRTLQDEYFKGVQTDPKAYETDKQNLDLLKNELTALATTDEEKLAIEASYQQARYDLAKKYGDRITMDEVDRFRTAMDDINAFLESDGTKAFAKAMQQAVGAMSNIFSSLTSAIDAETQMQTASIEARYDKEIERAGDNAVRVSSLEKQKEAEIAKVKAEASEKKFKMDVFSTIAQGAMSAVSAWNAGWQAGFPAGPVLAPLFMALSLATTGVQIAALKKQQQAAAATGYAEGGYTRKGRKYEPAGIVHAGEWVASQELLQNPATAAVIAALDHAQRTNTIGSLGTAVVQRSSPASLGTPPSSPASIGTPASADPSLARTLRILTRRLDEPFVTVNTVEGNRGIKRAQDRYNRLTRNR